MRRSRQFLNALQKLLHEYHLDIVEDIARDIDHNIVGSSVYFRSNAGAIGKDAYMEILIDPNIFIREQKRKRK